MIEISDTENLRCITINRPEKAGALTEDMLIALRDAVTGGQDMAALILTGVGKVFSAGADLEAARAGRFIEDPSV